MFDGPKGGCYRVFKEICDLLLLSIFILFISVFVEHVDEMFDEFGADVEDFFVEEFDHFLESFKETLVVDLFDEREVVFEDEGEVGFNKFDGVTVVLEEGCEGKDTHETHRSGLVREAVEEFGDELFDNGGLEGDFD